MNKIINKIMFLIALGVVGVTMVGCGGKKEKTLVMGCSAEYPPFEFRKDGKLVGFEIDLAKMICEKLGYELEIKDMKFDGLIAALNSKRVDFVMSGMTVTEDRVKRVDFSQMYYVPKFAIVYKIGELIDDVQMMKGKKIGTQIGTTMEIFLKAKAKELEGLIIKGMTRNPELIQEVKVGRLDGVMIEESQAKEFVKANSELGYSVFEDNAGEGYAIAFEKGSDLKAKFDEVIDELKKKGDLEKLLKKWEL